MTRRRISIACGALVALALVLFVPYLMAFSSLKKAMALGKEEANEAVVTALTGGPYELAALRAVDADDERLAIDEQRASAAFIVDGDGRAHVVSVAPDVRLSVWDGIKASIEKMFAGSGGGAVSSSSIVQISVGSLASKTPFVGVHHVVADGPHSTFVLRTEDYFTRCITTPHGYSPGETSLYGATDEDVAQWRDTPAWPVGW